MDFAYLGTVILLVLGFGFVIFWHELGHFLAAKWAGVKVEQFAVGFGQALISWRKGLGFRLGSSRAEYEQKLRDYLRQQDATLKTPHELADASANEDLRLEYAATQLGLGETEYRLNWIPLGGYVKMLGQDDMNPNATSEHPRAYNNKSIGKRMVIVSAGVIMNVILAIILFAVLFRIGFNVPPPVVGSVATGSPAQRAGIQVGDRILTIDGVVQHDFTKISMNVALVEEGQTVPVTVRGVDGVQRTLKVTPQREAGDVNGFLKLGISPAPELRGLDPRKVPQDWEKDADLVPPEVFAIRPGDTIVAINGQAVETRQFYKLDRALQESYGRPVELTVQDSSGQIRQVQLRPRFPAKPFNAMELDFAGMVPRATVEAIVENSSARGKLCPGDDVVSLTIKGTSDTFDHPSPTELRERLAEASRGQRVVEMVVLRDGQLVTVPDLVPQTRLETGGRGLGIQPGYDADHAVIGQIVRDSAADRARIPDGSTIVAIDGQPVASWYDVHRLLSRLDAPGTVMLTVQTPKAGAASFELSLSQEDLEAIRGLRYSALLALRELSEPRQTNNPFTAAAWGVMETRDLMVQFYLTLRRMLQGSIAASNAMGPIGIFHQGSKIADRGIDWLIWFLAMISANLAVVNFLPIPIVDGGLFMFLILEKIMRRPLSPRAQSIAQIVGLALIASVFLFVTYHDISRMF